MFSAPSTLLVLPVAPSTLKIAHEKQAKRRRRNETKGRISFPRTKRFLRKRTRSMREKKDLMVWARTRVDRSENEKLHPPQRSTTTTKFSPNNWTMSSPPPLATELSASTLEELSGWLLDDDDYDYCAHIPAFVLRSSRLFPLQE